MLEIMVRSPKLFMKNTSRIFALFIIASVVFSSCKTDRRAEKLPDEIGQFVYGFTSGTISKNSDIRVQFVGAPASAEMIGTEVSSSIFSLRPSIKGKAIWEDAQTLVFQPETSLQSGQPYVATVLLKNIFTEVPAEMRSFEFDFIVRNQMLDVSFGGMEAQRISDLTVQQLKGSVLTADRAQNENVEKTISAKQGSKKLTIEWSHQPENLRHDFFVKGITRSAKASKIKVTWNGKFIGAPNKNTRTIEVPAIGDFKVSDIKAIAGDKPHFQLFFSDPLDAKQNLTGLITVKSFSGKLRFAIEGNMVKVYPRGELAGDYEVVASSGIKSIDGSKMKLSSNWNLTFEQKKPAVRLVGNGVIIPQSDGLTFPFEAVSLNAVEVEVFKIYNNNILQFLQNNNLKGNSQIERVGRVILQKKVELNRLNPNANTSNWTRYALDLSNMVDEDPQAIYQVSLGFRPEYSTYACSSGNISVAGNSQIVKLDNRIDSEGEIKSIWNDYYGISGYFDDYDWGNRDNPCQKEYYNRDVFKRRSVLASNLGITVKEGADGDFFVAVADLRTAEKIGGVQVEFYDYQQQLLSVVMTDSEGMLRAKLDKKPFALIAKNNTDRGYMSFNDGNALSLSKFDVSGQRVQKGVKGFIYGERGVWRPGDSLFLNFILEDETGKLPKNHPIAFELKDSRGQIQEAFSITENINGIYAFKTATDSDASTGNWSAKIKVGGAVFTKNLKIETVKPNRLKVNLDFEKEQLLAADNDLSGKLQVNWLHGAPASGLKAKVEMQLQESRLFFKDYKKFTFSDPARSFNTSNRTVFDDVLDESGFAKIKTEIFKNENKPSKLMLNFKARAFEKGGDFSGNSFSIPYFPYESYAGVRLPRNRWGSERFDVGKDGTMSFVTLDHSGKPLDGRYLTVGVYKVNWNWWYDRSGRNVARFNSSTHHNASQTKSIQTNSNGVANWTLNFKERGRYLVRVCDSESGHCSGRYFYAGYPYYDDEDGNQNAKKEATMLAFSSDKESYQPGDVATVNVPSGEKGTILLTLENGSRVVESSWRKVKSGNNEIRFNVTKEMMPNIYAHVSLIQPHAQTENDLPIRMYGVVPITVEDPATELKPIIKMPDVLEPEQEFLVEISEKNGKDMAYTVAIVDDGLLDLTNFKTPDPHKVFYAKEALGVKTWDVYDDVLGAFGGELERILAVGGDGEAVSDEANQKANRFKPVVRHIGPFFLPKGSKKMHKIKMPNYVGSVRTMVIAAKDGAYGNAEKTTPVRKPLMLLATLPRVLSPGEKLRLPVNVFAMEKKVKNVKVKVEESSGLVKIGSGTQSLKFSKPSDEMAYFEIEIGEQIGVAKFDIFASGNGESASQQIEIQVRNPNPHQSRVYPSMISAGESWQSDFELVGMLGTNTGVLEVSNIPAMDLDRRLKYLIRYPYGCLEQTTSAAFPQLYVSRFVEMPDARKAEIRDNIQSGIDRLRLFQNADGGFNYWPSGNYVSQWASTYAGHFLTEAKALGYTIPLGMLENWQKFQKKTSELWSPRNDAERRRYGYYSSADDQLAQAYRLFALALSGAPELGAMNRLRGIEKLEEKPRWLLAAAYAASGRKNIGQDLIKALSTEVDPYRRLSGTFGSEQRDKAIILQALTLMGEKEKATKMLETVCEGLRQTRWLSTQDISYSLIAVAKFVGDFSPGSDLKFAYKLGSSSFKNEGSKMPVFQRKLDVENSAVKSLELKNTGGAPLFVRLSLSGQPLVGGEKSEASKLGIDVNYYSMKGQKINPKNIEQGTDFYARVAVNHPGAYGSRMEELALEQIFPAGWEIINSRMDAMSNTMKDSYSKFRDYRDDRVNTFFDLGINDEVVYHVLLNAAYQGKYYHPAVSCEAMYDNSIYARKAGMWVEVN